MNDCQGQAIGIGDIVVVAGRKGSSQWLTETRVVELKEVRGPFNHHTQLYDLVEKPVLEARVTKKGKTHFRHYTYQGSQQAIIVIAKGTGGNVTAPIVPILEGDEDVGMGAPFRE